MKHMRITALLLCVTLTLAVLPVPVAATENAVLSVSTASGERGETVTAEVSLSAVDGIASGHFNVVYDQAALTLVSAMVGDALSGANPYANSAYAANTVRVTFASTQALSNPGVMLRLVFQIKGNAAVGAHSIALEQVKLMNVNNGVVISTCEAGSITVQAVSMTMSSVEYAPGQDAQLEINLVGDLLPCGGSFELLFDPSVLLTASVQAEQAWGETSISLLSNVDASNGRLAITWASTIPVSALGKLCTITFVTSGSATGDAEVRFSSEAFYNENGNQIASFACTNGTITFTDVEEVVPMLYMIGGQRDSTGSATVRIVMDAPGLVCGGSFRLDYDASCCTLTEITAKTASVIVNPASTADANGTLNITWIHTSPPAEAEEIVELQFSFTGSAVSELSISEVSLKDVLGGTVEAGVYDGKVGVASALQCPVILIHTPTISGIVFDAAYCSQTPTESAKAVIAYYKSGQMLALSMPEELLSFNESGYAQFDYVGSNVTGADTIKVFLVNSSGSFVPMSESQIIAL